MDRSQRKVRSQSCSQAKDKAWKVGGKQVGKERKHGALSFVQVHRAGHMVPMDQPEVAMTMLNRFIANKALVDES